MIQKFFFLLIVLLVSATVFAQTIPVGYCGIVYTYDQAGNRIRRVFFCNNGVDPHPLRSKDIDSAANLSDKVEYLAVDALFPNPTTGKFSVTFSKGMNNASVIITNLTGQTIYSGNIRGNRGDFDLSAFAAGVYFLRIEEGGNKIVKKIIKQ